MKRKISSFMDRPWTWRTYLKCCGVGAAIYAVAVAGVAVYTYWEEIVEAGKRVIHRFKNWFRRVFRKEEGAY